MRALILNMPDRVDRYERTLENYPECLPKPERYIGKTPEEVTPPDWWRGGPIYASNRQNFIDMFDIASKSDDLTYIFEDDVCFCDGFEDKLNVFLNEVPNDWDVLYLGGQCWVNQAFQPWQISENVMRLFASIRTHAMIAKPETAGKIRDWLIDGPWGVLHIADNRMAQFMMQPENKVYAPFQFICGQRGQEKSTQCPAFFTEDQYWNNYAYIDLNGNLTGK